MKRPLISLALLASLVAADAAGAKLKVPKQFPTIQAAVDAAGPGDTIVIAAGTYVESVNVELANDLLLRAKGKVVVDGAGGVYALRLHGANDLRVVGLTLRNADYGVLLGLSTNVELDDCVVRETAIAGVSMGMCSGSRVVDSTVRDSAGHGVTFTLSSGCSVERTRIRDVGGNGVDGSGSTISILDNRIEKTGGHGVRLGGSEAATAWLVAGNDLRDLADDGVFLSEGSGSSILQNSMRRATDAGVDSFDANSAFLIAGNVVSKSGRGLTLRATDSIVRENVVKKSSLQGIVIPAPGQGLLLDGNAVTKSTLEAFLVLGIGNTLAHNTAKKSKGGDLVDGTVPGSNLYVANGFDAP
ncbi:MAG: nitrous oxide reductase family maturation protein NosD [Planctomycetota bacterium JB042]